MIFFVMPVFMAEKSGKALSQNAIEPRFPELIHCDFSGLTKIIKAGEKHRL
jgi:hypothetical protein